MFPQRKRTDLFGKRAEELALNLLIKKGYIILERNFHSRFGELDLVAIDGDTLVFVEVKARTSRKFGLPEEAVTKLKLWKIKKTAEYYSATHPLLPKKLRIDVVALMFEDGELTYSKVIEVF